ncbi:PHD finger protein 11 isoform X4 [Rhinatrema bivittatum]|uniref:PHD finger protein 11 isoform X4 n=1 Tax=Rhinatrema bivittatum TaxID=194408 RepID=UPI00112E0DD7|nr:PHD finger protein 11 isoform X4 [Rhinatrema bivittatum]
MAGENRRCSRRMEMESGCCGFCHLREQNEITGELYKSKDGSLCAHFNCMLFSSGLVQPNTPNINELGGFCLEDIKKEIKRGWKLKCSECKEAGATIGCDIKICKKTFHYQCAKNCKAEFFEDEDRGVYKLYCRIHSKNNSEDTLNNDGDQVETDKENKTEDDTTDDDQLDIMSIVSGGDDTNDEDFSLPEVHCADNNRGTPGINRNEKRNNLEECTGQQKEKEKCSDSELGETFTRSLSHRLEFTDTGPPKKQAKLATTGSTEKSTETTNPPNAKPEAMLMHEQPLQEHHHQLFQVLLATGCLKDAVLKAKQEIRNKIQKIEDEKASLYKEEKALDAFLTKF